MGVEGRKIFYTFFDVNYYKAYNLDASEFAQCLSGFETIPKN